MVGGGGLTKSTKQTHNYGKKAHSHTSNSKGTFTPPKWQEIQKKYTLRRTELTFFGECPNLTAFSQRLERRNAIENLALTIVMGYI